MIVQGSDEWHQARLGKVTASKVADVMARTKSGPAASRANYAAQLIIERLTGQPTESFGAARRASTSHVGSDNLSTLMPHPHGWRLGAGQVGKAVPYRRYGSPISNRLCHPLCGAADPCDQRLLDADSSRSRLARMGSGDWHDCGDSRGSLDRSWKRSPGRRA